MSTTPNNTWHGIPREQINWHPTVVAERCIGWGLCATSSGKGVYAFDYEANKPVVVAPLLQTPHNCSFCAPEPERELLTESATCYAMLDKFPISPGHALVIPKKHIAGHFDLSAHTKTAPWLMADRVKDLLTERFHPDGFNAGINIGAAAGQTVPHVHIHIISRYAGEVETPGVE